MPDRIRFAREFGGLEAFGLTHAGALFEPDASLSSRLRLLEERPGRTRFALALPGTPDERGRFTERPRALGTGAVWLSVFRAPPWSAVLRSRFSAPRSASLAEREWNLLCRLRAEGVGAPEPLAVGARGAGLVARRSFLIVRELEGALVLPRWLHPNGFGGAGEERARGLEALGRFLATLARSGVSLARLQPEDLWITPAGGDCEHDEPSTLGPRPIKNRLPGVALGDVAGARCAPLARDAWRARVSELLGALSGTLSLEEREHVRSLALSEREPRVSRTS